jgi:hypothetical protein
MSTQVSVLTGRRGSKNFYDFEFLSPLLLTDILVYLFIIWHVVLQLKAPNATVYLPLIRFHICNYYIYYYYYYYHHHQIVYVTYLCCICVIR